ncbi:MAG: GWxTD domain-containing protein [Thermoanaerobaculia bacterium]
MICSGGRSGERTGATSPLALTALAVALALLATPGQARKERDRTPEDLMNVLLSPGLSQWLLGAVSRIASEEEIRAFLQLTDDRAANEFIDAFWSKRIDPDEPWPGKGVRDVFDARAEEADRLFAEGIQLGRRTDRGVIHILFGEPEKRTYVQEEGRRRRTVEIWAYDRAEVLGLDGTRPKAEYYFAKEGEATVFTQRPRRPNQIPQGRIP